MLGVLVASPCLSCLTLHIMSYAALPVLLQTFNCVQRAHQNSLENQPIFLALLTLSGLQYPVTAATFGGLYLAGRIGYVEVRLSGRVALWCLMRAGQQGKCSKASVHTLFCMYNHDAANAPVNWKHCIAGVTVSYLTYKCAVGCHGLLAGLQQR
jgi:hypothetical protein